MLYVYDRATSELTLVCEVDTLVNDFLDDHDDVLTLHRIAWPASERACSRAA